MDAYGIDALEELQEDTYADRGNEEGECGEQEAGSSRAAKRARTLDVGYRQQHPQTPQSLDGANYIGLVNNSEYINTASGFIDDTYGGRANKGDGGGSTVNIYNGSGAREDAPPDDISDEVLARIQNDLETVVGNLVQDHELFEFVTLVQGYLGQTSIRLPDGTYAGFDNSALRAIVDKIIQSMRYLQHARRLEWQKRIQLPDYGKKIKYLARENAETEKEVQTWDAVVDGASALEAKINDNGIYSRLTEILKDREEYKNAKEVARASPFKLATPPDQFDYDYRYELTGTYYSGGTMRAPKDEKFIVQERTETDLRSSLVQNLFVDMFLAPTTYYALQLIAASQADSDRAMEIISSAQSRVKQTMKELNKKIDKSNEGGNLELTFLLTTNAINELYGREFSERSWVTQLSLPPSVESKSFFGNQPPSKIEALKNIIPDAAEKILSIHQTATKAVDQFRQQLKEKQAKLERTSISLSKAEESAATQQTIPETQNVSAQLEPKIDKNLKLLRTLDPATYVTVSPSIVSAMNSTFTTIKSTLKRGYQQVADASDLATCNHDDVRSIFAEAVSLKMRLNEVQHRRTGYVQNNHFGQVLMDYGGKVSSLRYYEPLAGTSPLEFRENFNAL